MPDLAYTVAVIENSHETQELLNDIQNSSGEEGPQGWGGEELEPSTKKTPKFTKKAGKKREYNNSEWNYEGIHFYNKVGLNGRDKQVRSKNRCGNNWRQSRMNTLKSTSHCISVAGVRRGKETKVRTVKMCLPYHQWMYLRQCRLRIMIISLTVHGRWLTSMMMTRHDVPKIGLAWEITMIWIK